MIRLLLCSLSLAWIACQSKPATPETKPDTPANVPPGTAPATTRFPAAGIIIGDGVRLRRDPSLQSTILTKMSTGDPIQILATADAKDTTSLDACEVFPMVQVKTAAGATGWIFGKFVFQVRSSGEHVPKLAPAAFDGRMLEIKICRNFGMGASDEEGLTGCREYYPVLLTDTKTGEHFLVPLSNPVNEIPGQKYWLLEHDEGAGDQVRSLKSQNGKLIAEIYSEYMEGCATFDVQIVKSGKGYVASCVNVKKLEQAACEKLQH